MRSLELGKRKSEGKWKLKSRRHPERWTRLLEMCMWRYSNLSSCSDRGAIDTKATPVNSSELLLELTAPLESRLLRNQSSSLSLDALLKS